jgi:ATP synthase F1 epsilon subunit
MSDKFTIEIITPDKTILKSEVTEVTIPSFEGQMGILKDHIPLITFLRPGIIIVQNQEEKKYFIEEGTVEFSDNNLLILTSTAKDLENMEKSSINDLIDQAEKKLKYSDLSDKDKYIMSYKVDTLKEINQ